jgi:autotransporter-associated beta strand protein
VWLWRNDTTFPLVTVDGGSVGLQSHEANADAHQCGPYVVSNSAYFAGYGNFALWLHGEVSGPGRLIKIGDGAVTLEGTNTYTGGTEVREGTLRGTTDGLIGLITNLSVVEFAQSLTGSFAGVIASTGEVQMISAGRVIIPSAQPYTGPTAITSGTLQVDGSLAGGAVTVGPAGVLAGTGVNRRAGHQLRHGRARRVRGHACSWPRTSPPTTSSVLRIEVGAAGHDLLEVGGTAGLAGELHGETVAAFDPAPGSAFVVLRAAAVTGTFAKRHRHPASGHRLAGGLLAHLRDDGGDRHARLRLRCLRLRHHQRGAARAPRRSRGRWLSEPAGVRDHGQCHGGGRECAAPRAALLQRWNRCVTFFARPGATDISYFVERAWPAAERRTGRWS